MNNRPLFRLLCLSVFLSGLQLYASAQIKYNADNTIKSKVFAEGAAHKLSNVHAVLLQQLELGQHHELKLDKAIAPYAGINIMRFTQWYKGILVDYSSCAVMTKDSILSFMTANVYRTKGDMSTTPILSAPDALQKAVEEIGADVYMWEDAHEEQALKQLTGDPAATYFPKGELVWVENKLAGREDRSLHLAYRFNIYAQRPHSRYMIHVDANTGAILCKDVLLKNISATGSTLYSGTVTIETDLVGSNLYRLHDYTRGQGVITYDAGGGISLSPVVDFTNTGTTWQKSPSIDVHWALGKIYDYWLKEHNRKGLDDANGKIIAYANYNTGLNNAYWNGAYMLFANGTGMSEVGFDPLVSLDVCAHEMGHGIVQYVSPLGYAMEPGALNEGFGDICGAVIESYYAPEKQQWYIAEELKFSGLRNLKYPKQFNNPDTYGGTYWTTVPGCSPSPANDYCGVHNNCTVFTKWFQLLSEGGKGKNDLNNDYELTGIGMTKAMKVTYATMAMISMFSDFEDARDFSINTAATLYGACSREVENVARAWYAVGLGTFVPCTSQVGFAFADTIINKSQHSGLCPALTALSIPLRVTGGPIGGTGNATVTIGAEGTAKKGVDYNIVNSTLSFSAGSSAGQNIALSILDNGDATAKTLKLYITIAAGSTNALVSYTYDTCIITIRGDNSGPDTGGNIAYTASAYDCTHSRVSPFFGGNQTTRIRYVITAQELIESGIKPNDSLTGMEIEVLEKNSTVAYDSFLLKIDTTTLEDVGPYYLPVNKEYYHGSYTTVKGRNYIPFTPKLWWDGTTGFMIESCHINAGPATGTDLIACKSGVRDQTRAGYVDWNFAGCYNTFFITSSIKPAVKFTQVKPHTPVETSPAKADEWYLAADQNTYFYSNTSGKLILNISGADTETGCTDVRIEKAGPGFTSLPAKYGAAQRSVKEFELSPAFVPSSMNYDMTLFFDSSELPFINPNGLYIVSTQAADTAMDSSNTEVVPATLIQSKHYLGFRAGLTRLGYRYFLSDAMLNLPAPPSISVNHEMQRTEHIRLVNNPFRDRIYFDCSTRETTNVQLRLLDITGRPILDMQKSIPAGSHRFDVDVSETVTGGGNYLLHVISPAGVQVYKMVKL